VSEHRLTHPTANREPLMDVKVGTFDVPERADADVADFLELLP
jgi:hypothetical protein